MNLHEELQKILSKDQVTVNVTILEQHSKDESYHTPHLPDVVVFPESTEDVSKVMKFACTNKIPVVPFGLGTSLEGHVIPYQGGISLDFQRMNKVLEVRPRDFLVRVQPGVTRSQVNKELKKYGLFFPVDPGADATLGGMAATNASGTTSVRYGVMRDQVRDLEVVLADGEIIRTGGLSAKSSSGYNLTGLFVGSEGTLGIFTELVLRVHGIPEEIMAARSSFPTVEQAVNTAVSILGAGIPVARVELVDARSIRQINRQFDRNYKEEPTLFLEFHGNKAGLVQDVELAKELAVQEECSEWAFETETKARAQLWEARHNLAYAFLHGSPGKKMMVTDVCVPLTELADAVKLARYELDESGLDGALLGHIGDGNYHALVMFNPEDAGEMSRAEKFNARLVEYALSRGGTCTGEHGVGVGKRKYQIQEHGSAVNIMTRIKQTLDPLNILNPGKVLPIPKASKKL